MPAADRLRHEIEHHRDLARRNPEEIWGWDSPAGRVRADRRARFFVTLGRIDPGKRVLEVGCGTGVFTRRVGSVGARLVALDLSAELLAKASGRGAEGVRFVRATGERLPFRDETFDVVYGCSILHHMDVENALEEIRRILRPGGSLTFSEPNLMNPQVFLMFKCKPLRPWFGMSQDEMAFTRSRIARILRRVGFDRFDVRYFDFLHPHTPVSLVAALSVVCERLERIPLLRSMSGSLLIYAER